MQTPRPPQDQVPGPVVVEAYLVEEFKRGARDEGPAEADWRGRSLGVHDEDVQYLQSAEFSFTLVRYSRSVCTQREAIFVATMSWCICSRNLQCAAFDFLTTLAISLKR